MKKLVVVVGARPNFMKIAPILKAFAATGSGAQRTLVHTGQHYDEDMSDVFFRQLGIPEPDVHLGVGSAPHGAQTGRILESFEALLLERRGGIAGVVVVGDVNSTMACALAAVKLGVPGAHVEAGLRSFDRSMPEEINRIVTDAVSDLLFVSEPSGVANLLREGVDASRIKLVGNVMIDTLIRELPLARRSGGLEALGVEPGNYALVTLHRPSNVDDGGKLGVLVDFLLSLSSRLTVVFPVHPRTGERLAQSGLQQRLEEANGVRLLPPLGYHENLALMSSAKFVLTDSGGIQEETSFLRVPCITLRPNTERPVTVTHGTNTVAGEDLGRVAELVDEILGGRYKQGSDIQFWDGQASRRIVEALRGEWLSGEACEAIA